MPPSLHSVVQPISPTPHLSRPDCKAFERKAPEREKGKRERERKSFPFFSLSVWLQKRSSSPVSLSPPFSAAGHLRNVGENRRSLIKVSSARPRTQTYQHQKKNGFHSGESVLSSLLHARKNRNASRPYRARLQNLKRKQEEKKTESSVDLGSTVCGFALSPHVPTRKHISLPSPFPPYMQT